MDTNQRSLGDRSNGGSRALSAWPPDQEALETTERSSPEPPISCREYERLLAGETVSWNQMLREHPMLATVTVARLVDAGIVRMLPAHDSVAGTPDFRLMKVKRSVSDSARDE